MTTEQTLNVVLQEKWNEYSAHCKTIMLLAELKAGRVTLDQVQITGTNWWLADKPVEEATVNAPAEPTAGSPVNRIDQALNGHSNDPLFSKCG